MAQSKLLEWKDIGDGKLKVKLDLKRLYGYSEELTSNFRERYSKLLDKHPETAIITQLRGNILEYESEQIIPEKKGNMKPLLLLFGNPASHSVVSGMFFSSRGRNKEREHQIWKVLREKHILDFYNENKITNNSERNEFRKSAIYNLEYSTPYKIGLAVYYSMPSPASGDYGYIRPGLNKLFGGEIYLKKNTRRRRYTY
jgi:hypothetical protein